jgi:hypothetical protein
MSAVMHNFFYVCVCVCSSSKIYRNFSSFFAKSGDVFGKVKADIICIKVWKTKCVDPTLTNAYIQSSTIKIVIDLGHLSLINNSKPHREEIKQETTNEMVATTNSGYSNDDGGFEFYEVTTTDPGPAMLVGTILISILLYTMLPFMVACGERRDRKRRAWEYKNRVEQKPSCADGAGTGGDDGTDNQPARELIMKNGVQLRQRKNSVAEKEPGMEGIVRQKEPNRTEHKQICAIIGIAARSIT